MFTDYIDAAMEKAHYEILPDNGGYYGKITGLQGVWANSSTLEGCRKELKEVLEEWIMPIRLTQKGALGYDSAHVRIPPDPVRISESFS